MDREARKEREKKREERIEKICDAIRNYRFMSGSLKHLRAYDADGKLIESAKQFAIEKHVPTAGYGYAPINEGDIVIVIHGKHLK